MEDLSQELRSLREENLPRVLPRNPETELSPSFGSLSRGVRQRVRRRLAAQQSANKLLDRLEGMLEGRLDNARTEAGSRLLGGPLPRSLSERILKDVTNDIGRFRELQRSCPVDAKEALRELTCKVADYGDRKDLAAYGEAPLSLPPVGLERG